MSQQNVLLQRLKLERLDQLRKCHRQLIRFTSKS
jgi:hypothetical protein